MFIKAIFAKIKIKQMASIAFYTFGILREKEGHPQVQGFFDRISSVFEQAQNSGGFIERNKELRREYCLPRFFDPEKHELAVATLSLWKDLESVCAFAYKFSHGDAFKNRNEWVVKPEWPTYVAWWVGDDKLPSREVACKRLEYIHDNESSPFAFNFKKPFDQNGNPVELDKHLIEVRKKFNETLINKS